jgi:hypothetical protein
MPGSEKDRATPTAILSQNPTNSCQNTLPISLQVLAGWLIDTSRPLFARSLLHLHILWAISHKNAGSSSIFLGLAMHDLALIPIHLRTFTHARIYLEFLDRKNGFGLAKKAIAV